MIRSDSCNWIPCKYHIELFNLEQEYIKNIIKNMIKKR